MQKPPAALTRNSSIPGSYGPQHSGDEGSIGVFLVTDTLYFCTKASEGYDKGLSVFTTIQAAIAIWRLGWRVPSAAGNCKNTGVPKNIICIPARIEEGMGWISNAEEMYRQPWSALAHRGMDYSSEQTNQMVYSNRGVLFLLA